MPPPQPQSRRLLALTAVLTVIAVAAIAAVLSERGEYEDRLRVAYELEAGGARLLAAGLAEESALRATGRRAPGRRLEAAADFDAEAIRAEDLAEGDRESERLVAARVQAQRRTRAASRAGRGLEEEGRLTLAALDARRASRGLADRQEARREAARDDVRHDTRVYLLVAIGGAVFSLAGTLLAGRQR